MKNKTLRKQGQPRNPVDVFHKCPACGCHQLIASDVDVVCSRCDWMSCQAHVDSGGFDECLTNYFCDVESSFAAIESMPSRHDLVVA